MSERRGYYLGGGSTTESWLGRFFRLVKLVAIAGGVGVVGSLLLGSPVPLIVCAVAGGVGAVLLSLRDAFGRLRIAGLTARAGVWLRRRGGCDSYVPGLERSPWVLQGLRGWAVPVGGSGAELAVVEDRSTKSMLAFLRLDGARKGIPDQRHDEWMHIRFEKFLNQVAQIGSVSHVDLATRGRPWPASEYTTWLEEHLDVPDSGMGSAMREQAGEAALTFDRYSQWMVVKMPLDELRELCRLEGSEATTEALTAAACGVLGKVAALAKDAGLRPLHGFSPTRYGALLRSLWDPSFEEDDLDELTSMFSGIPGFAPAARGLAVGAGQWLHAVGTIDAGSWPTEVLYGGALDQILVTGAAAHRLVVVSFPLVRRSEALVMALAASTEAGAASRSQEKSGATSTGLEDLKRDASTWVIQDIAAGGYAGCKPMLRVMVSAVSARELTAARGAIETAAVGGLGVTDIRWYDDDHTRAMVTVLPLGRGVKA